MLNPNLNLGGTISFTKTALVAGTGTSYTTTVATNFIIDGKFGTVFATKTNQAVPTTDANTGAAFPVVADDKGMVLVFGVNLAGAIQLVQGGIKDMEPGTLEFKIAPPFPSLPADFCPIGYAICKNDSGSNYTVASTDWADIDTTFVNIAIMPDRPQES
ncbi:MAG: hypothetical protein COA78_12140 [Blastopirellula sp.]|nr:MAG: hypothetical protein COA78_12140 [Blastopirellula sp.]